jgi:hypothetical protein
LKDPPVTYFYPPLDIFAKLASVKANLQNDVYPNEYTFQEDLYQVFAPAHDGHFVLYPDALTEAFEWGRQLALVSISSDGKELPEIYVYGESCSLLFGECISNADQRMLPHLQRQLLLSRKLMELMQRHMWRTLPTPPLSTRMLMLLTTPCSTRKHSKLVGLEKGTSISSE